MTVSYIGLFRSFPSGKWQVTFPDLPECTVEAADFEEARLKAGEALRDHLADLEGPAPRARGAAELLMDAVGDWVLARAFVDAVMHPINVVDATEATRTETGIVAKPSRAKRPGPALAEGT